MPTPSEVEAGTERFISALGDSMLVNARSFTRQIIRHVCEEVADDPADTAEEFAVRAYALFLADSLEREVGGRHRPGSGRRRRGWMMANTRTAWLRLPARSVEKFSLATRHLASDRDPLPERLRGALREILPLSPDQFPEDETRERWQVIRDRIDRESAFPDGTIANAVDGMGEGEAIELAREIVSITMLLRDLRAGLYDPPSHLRE